MRFCYLTSSGLITISFLVLSAFSVQGQITGQSPYSRFGIGNLENASNAIQYGLGGLAAAFADPNAINSQNPGTYGRITRPVFQIDFRSTQLKLSNAEQSEEFNITNIQNFGFAFPIPKRNFAFAFGLRPYSKIGYNITDLDEIEEIGDVAYTYDGEGGLNKAYFGMAKTFHIKEKLSEDSDDDDKQGIKHIVSVGGNFNYYLGKLSSTRRVIFGDDTFYNTRITSEQSIGDIGADFGVHYETNLSEKRDGSELLHRLNLRLGASYALEAPLNIEQSFLTESYTEIAGNEIVIDTTNSVPNRKGTMYLPSIILGGFQLEYITKNDRNWRLGADYKIQDWNNFRVNFDGEDFADPLLETSNQISVGVQYTPKFFPKPQQNLLQKMNYRIGVRLSNTYLRINGDQLDEKAISGGFTLPLTASRSGSRINFGMEFGSRGSTDNGLIKEEFMSFQLGMTFSPYVFNKWFVQSKYD